MKIDIILVHTGTVFPDYINDCITQLKKYQFNIHLILSECLFDHLNHSDIIVVKAEDYFDDFYNSYEIHNHDTSFRDGFWKRTSSRFFLISTYSKKNNLLSFFHIENDILMFSDLSSEKSILDNSVYDMAVVVDSERRCIPSVMYFRNSDIVQRLSMFISTNNTNNDMSNVFNFFSQNRDVVVNLPLLPNSINLNSGLINYNNLYSEMMSIFDDDAIGQYLGGIDTRSNPRDTIGFINETTVFDVSIFDYYWVNGEPFAVIDGGEKIKINNLHIHSKDLKKFI